MTDRGSPERFQEKSKRFSGSEARPPKDLEQVKGSVKTRAAPSRISTEAHITSALDALFASNPELAALGVAHADVPLRLLPSGFAGWTNIVISQLLSVAAANTIHGRLKLLLGDITPENFLAADPDAVRGVGMTAAKYKCLRALAEAELAGEFHHDSLLTLSQEEALKALTRFPGIGVWSAEIYLLFCAGHADVFPAGDLILRKMAGQIAGLDAMPDITETQLIAERWAPHRGVAARLLWAAWHKQNDKKTDVFD